MKKSILILIVIFITVSNLIAQSAIDPGCIYCKDNEKGKYSSVFGSDNTSTGKYSVASGYLNSATGDYSSAFGKGNQASGLRSFAAGLSCYALAGSSFALGQYAVSGATNAIVIGTGYGSGSGEFLGNGNAGSLMIGFHSSKPTFFVSKSIGGVNATGKIGIGNITAPEAKLHIKADNNEDATILLEPTGSGYEAQILFDYHGHSIFGKNGEPLTFSTGGAQDFLFENGNVGIGITDPNEKLEVNGNILQTPGHNTSTSQIKAPDANGLKLTDQDDNGIFVDDGGNVGIGTDNPVERLQIGDRWTFHNGNSNKIIGYNFKWDGGSKRIAEDEVSIMKFSSSGNIVFQTAILGASGSPITSWNYPLTLMNDGNVGIGTTTPDQKLELSDGGIQLNGEYGIGFNGDIPYNGDAGNDRAKIYYDNDFGGSYKDYLVIEKTDNNTNTDGGIAFTTKGSDNVRDILMVIKGNGNVGIGTTTADEMLTVAGYINARQVKVDITAGGADFVFDDDYELPLLDDVDDYVNKHNHLPDIPSADEMKENGLLLGEMQIKLLQKIEEMTLYLIELKKENEDIKLKMAELLNSNNININNNEE